MRTRYTFGKGLARTLLKVNPVLGSEAADFLFPLGYTPNIVNTVNTPSYQDQYNILAGKGELSGRNKTYQSGFTAVEKKGEDAIAGGIRNTAYIVGGALTGNPGLIYSGIKGFTDSLGKVDELKFIKRSIDYFNNILGRSDNNESVRRVGDIYGNVIGNKPGSIMKESVLDSIIRTTGGVSGVSNIELPLIMSMI